MDRTESRKVLSKAQYGPIIGLKRWYYHSNDRDISFKNTTNEDVGGRSRTSREKRRNFWLADTRVKVRVGEYREFDWFREGQLMA